MNDENFTKGLTGDQMLKKANGRNTAWDLPPEESMTERFTKGFKKFIAYSLNVSIGLSSIGLAVSPIYAVSVAGLTISELFYSVYGYITWDMAKTLIFSLISRGIIVREWGV